MPRINPALEARLKTDFIRVCAEEGMSEHDAEEDWTILYDQDEKNFIVVEDEGSEGCYRCTACGHTFWADACTEQNLVMIKDRLQPQCPECGARGF